MKVEHDATQNRFVARVGGGEAELVYAQRDARTLDLLHTEVPAPARGEGVGDALARAVFDYARERGYHVVPSCRYVQHWLTEHPDQRDLVVDERAR